MVRAFPTNICFFGYFSEICGGIIITLNEMTYKGIRAVWTDCTKAAICAVLSFFTLSCNKEEVRPPAETIKIVGPEELVMVTGGSEKFEFIVSPPNADFNHDVSSPDCQVKLKRITNAPVLNYRIS